MLDQTALARSAYQLQPLAPSLNRVAALVCSQEPDLRAIVQVISIDPVITGKLLNVANSAYSGAGQQIGTVKEAVTRLGSGTILRLLVGAWAKPLLEHAIPAYGLSKGELWRHSTAAALAAEALGGYCTVAIPPAAFTAALLHDIGKLVLADFLTPELTASLRSAVANGSVVICQAETEILSVHHGEVGGLIAKHWKLPEPIVEGIIFHHHPGSSKSMVPSVVHISDAVANRVMGRWRPEDDVRHGLADTYARLGMRDQDFRELCEAVGKRFQEVRDEYH
jgi:HD-like signal output (HDOD) protein